MSEENPIIAVGIVAGLISLVGGLRQSCRIPETKRDRYRSALNWPWGRVCCQWLFYSFKGKQSTDQRFVCEAWNC
jgi:hypothetical protein